MKFTLFGGKKRETRKTISDYKQEILMKQGREQFKTLIKRGLSVPIALL
ncbi:MAG: hypothetical protein M1444_03445 [Patescibacteria group bacterium]|nr:hypothetical protein [Patescibacteria group bacterium]